jgi:3-phenylpropionate/trans-cinnamate dioxygenase ferredoxin component
VAWQRAAYLIDTLDRDVTPMRVGGHDILLCRWQGLLYAVENRCSHAQRPLDGGEIREGTIVCPWHGACFFLQDGSAASRPAMPAIRSYAVSLEGNQVLVDVGDGT